jgi:hypothetical protein
MMRAYYSVTKPVHILFHAAAIYGVRTALERPVRSSHVMLQYSLLDVHAFILKDMFLIPVSHV